MDTTHSTLAPASLPLSDAERASPAVRKLWLRYYADYRPEYFFELIVNRVHPSDHILEIGAGSGQNKQNHFDLRNRVSRYVGIDPDPAVLSNPFSPRKPPLRRGILAFSRFILRSRLSQLRR
jgi:SAM-dependent methyltransferase